MGNETTKKNEQFKEDTMQSIIKSHNIKGLKKKMELTDQDTWDIIEEISPNVKYFAVYDGHGVKGREASEGLKKEIHKKLGTKDGGNIYIFATTTIDNKHNLIITKNI